MFQTTNQIINSLVNHYPIHDFSHFHLPGFFLHRPFSTVGRSWNHVARRPQRADHKVPGKECSPRKMWRSWLFGNGLYNRIYIYIYIFIYFIYLFIYLCIYIYIYIYLFYLVIHLFIYLFIYYIYNPVVDRIYIYGISKHILILVRFLWSVHILSTPEWVYIHGI